MKRWWLFAGYNYYPSGGMDDFRESFDDILEGCVWKEEQGRKYDWYQIVDSQDGTVTYLT